MAYHRRKMITNGPIFVPVEGTGAGDKVGMSTTSVQDDQG